MSTSSNMDDLLSTVIAMRYECQEVLNDLDDIRGYDMEEERARVATLKDASNRVRSLQDRVHKLHNLLQQRQDT